MFKKNEKVIYNGSREQWKGKIAQVVSPATNDDPKALNSIVFEDGETYDGAYNKSLAKVVQEKRIVKKSIKKVIKKVVKKISK